MQNIENTRFEQPAITEEEIKAYLIANPYFFEQHANLLADIHLPSPHGSGTISLAERQQLAQRDKINALESRFTELVLNAKDNDEIANKIHALNISLHQAKNFNAIEQLVSHGLPEIFNLNDTCLRIWANPVDPINHTNLVFSEVAIETKTWVAALSQPFCGAPPAITADDWFLEPAASVAIIALHHYPIHAEISTQIIGFLALASDDKQHFYPEMGADFLNKIGAIFSAALSRHLVLD